MIWGLIACVDTKIALNHIDITTKEAKRNETE